MKFTAVPISAFDKIQINAGIVLKNFAPATGTYQQSDIIGLTTGGNNFQSNPTYTDFGDDVDNVPANTWQMKRIQSYDPALSTNFVSADTALGKKLVAAADIDSSDSTHIIPRGYLDEDDFDDLWLVGDYSNKNGATNGGFCAIHIKHALNTGGFQWQSTKDGKGQFAGDFHGHYDMEDIDDIPFELYIKAGSAEPTPTP